MYTSKPTLRSLYHIYIDIHGNEHLQLAEDAESEGPLIDPDTGEEMKLGRPRWGPES